MANIKSYADLVVWQKSMVLVKKTYLLMKNLPKEETYALSDQIRRAVVSIPSNIAEGQGRNSSKDFVHFLSISLGSVYEIQTQFIICRELGYLSNDDVSEVLAMTDEITKMLHSLMKSICPHG